MIRRIKQFIAAYNAKLTGEDHALINSLLNSHEQALFYEMAIFDQYHTLNVYKTAQSMLINYPQVNTTLLTKACLLHDIGRNKAEISIVGKILPVLFSSYMPSAFIKWTRNERNNNNFFLRQIAHFGNFFYLYKYHPQLGALKIKKLSEQYPDDKDFYLNLETLISLHHILNYPNSSQELKILQAADALN